MGSPAGFEGARQTPRAEGREARGDAYLVVRRLSSQRGFLLGRAHADDRGVGSRSGELRGRVVGREHVRTSRPILPQRQSPRVNFKERSVYEIGK
jgi:hypothetical protein